MTTTTVRWPDKLRTQLESSFQLIQEEAFRVSEVQAGGFYSEGFTRDRPVIIPVTFRFDTVEAAVFQSWFFSPEYCDRGQRPFIFTIPTPFCDKQEVEAQFITVPKLTAKRAKTWDFTGGQLWIREMPVPDIADFVVPAFEQYGRGVTEQLEALDRAVNISYPEANE